jgi:hypothetical protein
MKTVLQHKNNEFWVMPLKHVLNFMNLVNHYGIPKLLAIAHKNGPKSLINHSGTPKLWAISHENGPKMQK